MVSRAIGQVGQQSEGCTVCPCISLSPFQSGMSVQPGSNDSLADMSLLVVMTKLWGEREREQRVRPFLSSDSGREDKRQCGGRGALLSRQEVALFSDYSVCVYNSCFNPAQFNLLKSNQVQSNLGLHSISIFTLDLTV